jgi:hypothetical protein
MTATVSFARFRFAPLRWIAAQVELSLTDCSEPFVMRTYSVQLVRSLSAGSQLVSPFAFADA